MASPSNEQTSLVQQFQALSSRLEEVEKRLEAVECELEDLQIAKEEEDIARWHEFHSVECVHEYYKSNPTRLEDIIEFLTAEFARIDEAEKNNRSYEGDMDNFLQEFFKVYPLHLQELQKAVESGLLTIVREQMAPSEQGHDVEYVDFVEDFIRGCYENDPERFKELEYAMCLELEKQIRNLLSKIGEILDDTPKVSEFCATSKAPEENAQANTTVGQDARNGQRSQKTVYGKLVSLIKVPRMRAESKVAMKKGEAQAQEDDQMRKEGKLKGHNRRKRQAEEDREARGLRVAREALEAHRDHTSGPDEIRDDAFRPLEFHHDTLKK